MGFPFLLLYLLGRIARDRRYLSGLQERFGWLPDTIVATVPGNIWLHAVSVGEVLSAVELIHRLRRRMPEARVFVSVTTLAGRAMADQKLPGLADGVFYTPLDYIRAVRRVLRRIDPAVVVVMETEIWPNLYREAKRRGCGLLVVNGRISDKAFPRYRRLRWFFKAVLELPDLILAQTEGIRERYFEAGAPPEKVRVGGNLKYDFDPGKAAMPEAVRDFLDAVRPAHVWLAASTMPPQNPEDPDEDDVVLAAFRELETQFPRLLVILVPRRPERFSQAAEKLAAAGVKFMRRSALQGDETIPLPGVLLLDTIGELGGVFPASDVVFMGGTLVHRGGHNILEPAFFEKAVIAGPHMENFAEIAEEFTRDGGLVRIERPAELGPAVAKLLRDEEERARIGSRARELASAKRGATDRAVEEISRIRDHAFPAPEGSRWVEPLAALWRAGAERRRRRETAEAGRLDCQVISVGGISMGGAGKTPFVLWLAKELRAAGRSPAILTRGYRRRKPEACTLIGPGEPVAAALTGDEAQIFIKAAVAPVGIGKDRAMVGRRLVERFRPDVVILDDGFQHWKLRRDFDIVLIDALDPFGRGHVFPRGRLREDLSALERAQAFVITRAEKGRTYEGIISNLRNYNSAAPVFLARVVPQAWVDAETGAERDAGALRAGKAAAFCGLGNPRSFYRTLAELGVEPVYTWQFGDHHHYRPVELKRLAHQAKMAGADWLVTTEKDIANLDHSPREWSAGLPLYWLRIGMEVEGAVLDAALRWRTPF